MFRNIGVLGVSTLAFAIGAPGYAADMKPGPAGAWALPSLLQRHFF